MPNGSDISVGGTRVNAASFLLRCTCRWIRELYQRYRVFALHQFLLPAGSEISRADAVRIGKHFGMGTSCRIYCHDPEKGSSISIGDNVALNDNVMINADCGGRIVIGNDVLISPNVVIRAANHRYEAGDSPIRQQGHAADVIRIGDDVWIGANAVVLAGVTIGRGAVIGAGSVVTRDIAEYTVAAGVPARPVGTRGSDRTA